MTQRIVMGGDTYYLPTSSGVEWSTSFADWMAAVSGYVGAVSAATTFVSVATYGALGGGSVDESAEIQDASDAANAAGLPLFFPPGTYLCQNVTIPAGMKVFGLSRELVTLKLSAISTATSASILELTGDNVHVSGITFDGNKANQSGKAFVDDYDFRSCRASIVAVGRDNIAATGCRFKNSYSSAFVTQDSSRVAFKNNIGRDNNFETCYIYYSSLAVRTSGHQVTDNDIQDTGSGDAAVNGNAILLSSVDNFIVRDNILKNQERNGVKIEHGKNGTVSGNVIDTVTLANFAGLQCQGTFENINVKGNTIKNAHSGIQFNQLATGQTAYNCSITDNTIQDLVYVLGEINDAVIVSLGFDGGEGFTVSNNTIRNHQRYVLQLTGKGRDFVVNGNNAVGDGVSANQKGFQFKASVGNLENLTVQGNIIDLKTVVTSEVCYFSRSSSWQILFLNMQGNMFLEAQGTSVITTDASDMITGIFANNWYRGSALLTQSGLKMFNNYNSNTNTQTLSGEFRTVTTTPQTLNTMDSNVLVNMASPSAVAITLPAGLQHGSTLTIKDAKGDALSNNITISPFPGIGHTIDGGSSVVVNTNYGSFTFLETPGGKWLTIAKV